VSTAALHEAHSSPNAIYQNVKFDVGEKFMSKLPKVPHQMMVLCPLHLTFSLSVCYRSQQIMEPDFMAFGKNQTFINCQQQSFCINYQSRLSVKLFLSLSNTIFCVMQNPYLYNSIRAYAKEFFSSGIVSL
jgi:hypothetical protein